MDCRKDGIMTPKILGAILVIAGCGGFGAAVASSHRKTELTLRRLSAALDFMECELQYRMTPLPELCRLCAGESAGFIRTVLTFLAEELENQILPDVKSCMNSALKKVPELPPSAAEILKELSKTLGRFDLNGQLKGIDSVRAMCCRELERLSQNREQRLRSYQTLGLCAGAALAILFL